MGLISLLMLQLKSSGSMPNRLYSFRIRELIITVNSRQRKSKLISSKTLSLPYPFEILLLNVNMDLGIGGIGGSIVSINHFGTLKNFVSLVI